VERADSFADAFDRMADRLATGDWSDLRNGDFLNHVGESMAGWLDCIDALDAARERVPADD
jgi:hypothetical protein